MRIIAGLALALLAGNAAAQGGGAPYSVRETGQGFASLQQAVDAIGDGAGTILIAPGRYRDCAVQQAGSVAYVAAQPGMAIFDGGVCEGKAALVLRGREARVEGLVFQNLAVPDGNGAGIRMEKGRLLVRESLFRDSESGILSANDPNGEIRIEQSTFSGLGRCDRGLSCAHSIYIGDFGTLSVARVRFERGTGGHYVKTRTPRVEVVDSSFDDTAGRATNYMIDLSNGSSGTIARNVFVQGPNKENYSALIMIAPEGRDNSSDGLLIADNDASVAPAFTRRTTFVADRSGEGIRMENNRLGPRIAPYERR
ncbi:MAG: right-handed parallel beta-helix repeat-containing protein [Allosphingosinicella sp.]|uniref:right-handed parallel beta-helix repeat-containing protein n=1 Tax=Allosphingosinicella sp. TaxID=2823234 RepID=UPI003943AF86